MPRPSDLLIDENMIEGILATSGKIYNFKKNMYVFDLEVNINYKK